VSSFLPPILSQHSLQLLKSASGQLTVCSISSACFPVIDFVKNAAISTIAVMERIVSATARMSLSIVPLFVFWWISCYLYLSLTCTCLVCLFAADLQVSSMTRICPNSAPCGAAFRANSKRTTVNVIVPRFSHDKANRGIILLL